jgi:RNA polymerase sigma-70 factor, ECF subfamily
LTQPVGSKETRVDDVDRHARLDALFRSHGGRVLAYLLHRTDPETAQDVLQEVFVIAFRKAESLPEPPTGWLFAAARRVLANSARGQRRRDHLALRLSGAAHERPDGDIDDTAGRMVTDALARLSTADREVLTLSAWYELTADEAAQALGCSRSAYGVRLHRARRRLAQQLQPPHRIERSDRLPEAIHE